MNIEVEKHGLPDWLRPLILVEFKDGSCQAMVQDHRRSFEEGELYEIWWCPWPDEAEVNS